jgi:hypothetical protein
MAESRHIEPSLNTQQRLEGSADYRPNGLQAEGRAGLPLIGIGNPA